MDIYVYAPSLSINLLMRRDGDPDVIVLTKSQKFPLSLSQSDNEEILIADLESFPERIEGRKQFILNIRAYDADIPGAVFIVFADLSSPLELKDRADHMIEMGDASDLHILQ